MEFIFDRSVLNLPGSCIPMLSSASAQALRVLIAAASARAMTAADVAKLIGIPQDEVEKELRFWEENGILSMEDDRPVYVRSTSKEVESARPSYTGEDIERICADADVREMIDVCSVILGKTFTPTEAESLLYLRDGLRLDFEYIVRLCKFCYDIGKPSIRYIEKVGISLYDSGAVTVGALEAYISKEERKSDMEYRIRKLFGLGERMLTPKEREYLSVWTIDWNLSFEIISLAYNEMMSAIEKPKFSYENGILKKWIDAGCRTKEEIEAFQATRKKEASATRKKAELPKKEIGFDLDEFFEAATRRAEGLPSDDDKKNG